MAFRDLKSPTGVTMRVETCTGDTSLLYLEIGDDDSVGGFGYLDAADRRWLRDELAKWDSEAAQTEQVATEAALMDLALAPVRLRTRRTPSHPLSLCKGCAHDTYKADGSQLCTLYHIATKEACAKKVERKPTP
jgi:hypothetical protein